MKLSFFAVTEIALITMFLMNVAGCASAKHRVEDKQKIATPLSSQPYPGKESEAKISSTHWSSLEKHM